jgi:intein/homing endonuclease
VIVRVCVEDEEIETTPTHPFWVIGKGWVAAGDIEAGDKVYLYSGEGREVKEVRFEYLDTPIKVYNFEVEDWHTYFVSEQDVFVHNSCKGKGTRSTVGKLTGSLDGLTSAERKVVNDLLSQGKNVEIIPRSNVQGVSTPDFIINGVKTEFKTLNGTSLNTPVTRITDAFKQSADAVIIDARNVGITAEQANQILNRAAGTYQNKVLPGQVEIWTVDGIIRR